MAERVTIVNKKTGEEKTVAKFNPSLARDWDVLQSKAVKSKPEDTAKPATKKATVKKAATLEDNTVEELQDIAREREITGFSTMKKAELITAIEKAKNETDKTE